jgi:Family of unknown function (DUF6152)
MNMKFGVLIAGVLGVLSLHTAPIIAHHAFAAEYDASKPVTVKGVVTKIEWTNPHARFYVDGTDEKGTKAEWNFELASVNSLVRHGWTRKALNPGDQVTVKGFLARASASATKANATEVLFPDGRTVFAGSAQAGDNAQ